MIKKYDTNNFNMNFKTSFLLFLIIFILRQFLPKNEV
jgi:hypothetical protein